MNTSLVEGYTKYGYYRAADIVDNSSRELIRGLDHLNSDVGARPFSTAYTVFSVAITILIEQGWTPEELAEHAAELSRNYLEIKTPPP